MTSAENYRTLRAELETPEKAALVYRDFVRKAVRRSVLDWQAFRPELIMDMAAEDDIPEADREEIINYIGKEFRGLHEGNVIRYRLPHVFFERPDPTIEGITRVMQRVGHVLAVINTGNHKLRPRLSVHFRCHLHR